MSAYVVEKSHINAMLNSWLHSRYGARWHHDGKWHELTTENANQVGQMLLDENIKSVSYRYKDSQLTDLPSRTDTEYLIPFEHHFTHRIPSPIEAIKITHCYDYQSCEHPEWKTSEAKVFCDSLIDVKLSELPGYDAAPWDWQEPANDNLIRLV